LTPGHDLLNLASGSTGFCGGGVGLRAGFGTNAGIGLLGVGVGSNVGTEIGVGVFIDGQVLDWHRGKLHFA